MDFQDYKLIFDFDKLFSKTLKTPSEPMKIELDVRTKKSNEKLALSCSKCWLIFQLSFWLGFAKGELVGKLSLDLQKAP